jgi:serine protease Do
MRFLLIGLGLFAGAALSSAAPGPVQGTILLRGGGSLHGTILVQQPDRVVVDLGFTVLTIPGDEVASVQEADAGAVSRVVEEDLFRVETGRPALTVKENVARVGEAVVQVRTASGLGSGFFIHPDGWVVTNHHVIAGETEIAVVRFQGAAGDLRRINYQNIRIVAMDPALDLALLRIEGEPAGSFPVVPIGDSDELRQGQGVFAIGSPLGLERTVSEGIISLRNRAFEGRLYIQTTTQINPGNSGGPLFNARGEVVGVNNMKAMMVGIEGLNFAIPSTVLKLFLRNRDAFAYDPRSPNAGFRYHRPASPQP